jgi:hypothetical protein
MPLEQNYFQTLFLGNMMEILDVLYSCTLLCRTSLSKIQLEFMSTSSIGKVKDQNVISTGKRTRNVWVKATYFDH